MTNSMDKQTDYDKIFNERFEEYTSRLITRGSILTNDEYIQTQRVLALIYINQQEYDSAATCLKAALSSCNRQEDPVLWATINHQIGNVYFIYDKLNELQLSLSYLDNALEVYLFDSHPAEYMQVITLRKQVSDLIKEHQKEEAMESVWGPFKADIDETLCFILMPFTDEAIKGVYEMIIKPTVVKNGLTPKRADSFKESKPIMPDVWKGIITAKIIIADLTNFNANVYYELGLCHALNKHPILMIQKEQKLPFDLSPFRSIFYSKEIYDYTQAKKELDEYIKTALNRE